MKRDHMNRTTLQCRLTNFIALFVSLTPCLLVTLSISRAAEPGWLKPLTWRCIGPANMGGRITALAVYEADPTTYWVATASGGLLKTTNNGVTFEHQFDHEATVSIGDVCVAPSDKNIVWVGTGESNPRNSVSYGDGVYKSVDGGKTWLNMGLKKSFQTGRIRIHPKNSDIVYVGALGRLYGPNEERGLFKTTDGGKTWEKILYVDDKTGVIDLQMHPADPETLLVATYERQRDGYDYNDPAKKLGAGSGLYRTSDGGRSWKKIRTGLPTCKLGRLGIDWYRKDPNVVFLLVESEKIGGTPRTVAGMAYLGIQAENNGRGVRVTQVNNDSPAERAGLKIDDVIVRLGERMIGSYADLTEEVARHKGGEKVKVRLRRGQEIREAEVTLAARGNATGGEYPYLDRLGGQAANVQNKQGPDGFEYGGVYKSIDGGESWTRLNSLNPRPMYFSQIRVDPNDDNYIYVLGISLHRSRDGGKTFDPEGGRGVHGDHHALWINPRDGRHMILGNDGGYYVTYDRTANWDRLNHMAIGQFYHVAIDSRRDYRVYGGLQDNGSWGGPSRTHSSTGPINEDWFRVGGGDGYRCAVDPNDADLIYSTSQWGGMRRLNLRTGETVPIRPSNNRRYRFNWNTPFLLSHHNSHIFYCAGNVVFRSLDRGSDLRAISPDITATERGSATALAESPRNPDVLYVGTDDGYLWVTRDGGKEWTNVTKNVGLPGPRCVASIEASRFEEGRAYVAFDAHRSDDDEPYVYVTEDFGKTWKSLRGNLPWGSTRVLREDIENPNLLYLGTEFGAWCSLNRGQTWEHLNTNLPTVAVHEFAIHPTAGEIVAATHGRSFWILDVTALRQLTPQTLQADARIYRPATAVLYHTEPSRGQTNRRFTGDNPPSGATIWYSLGKKASKASLKVLDVEGKLVRELTANTQPGLHKTVWDLRRAPARRGRGQQSQETSRPVAPGSYLIVLTVDGNEQKQALRVEE
ncbi:MAG TPA: PDZ domain-containing protein [Gemmataceae bacterium]